MKRVALITGGSRGIGLGIAKKLAQNNFDLIINGTRVANEVDDVLQELKIFGGDVIYCRGEYCVSKAGLSMATQLFAVRLGEFDIPVYEVRPGIINTDMTSGVKEKYDKLIKAGLCLQKRWGEPEDVGKVVASLAKGEFM